MLAYLAKLTAILVSTQIIANYAILTMNLKIRIVNRNAWIIVNIAIVHIVVQLVKMAFILTLSIAILAGQTAKPVTILINVYLASLNTKRKEKFALRSAVLTAKLAQNLILAWSVKKGSTL